MILSLSCSVIAQERTDSVFPGDAEEDLTVSIITCDPGPDVYELCGHAAIRIRSEKMDSIWNYGIFDFSSPNFIYRFCKGQTDYMVYGYQFDRFMYPYVSRGSRVTEQVLSLNQDEARHLRKLLQIESLPENRVYRYNYVRDNCATRPWKRITQASERSISLPDTLYFPTFRAEMRHFHRNYPWYQFGIDLVLGSGLDYPLAKDEDIFAPPVLQAKIADGSIGDQPLASRTAVLFPGGDATLPPTPWYLTPMMAGVIMLVVSIGTAFAYIFRGRLWRWWISLYFLVSGIAGIIVTFLVFFSEHEATSPNLLIFWLNPLQLIVAVGIWLKSWKKILVVMAAYNILVAVALTILLGVTSFGIQVLNHAVWPMLWSIIPLSVTILYFNGVLKLKIRK